FRQPQNVGSVRNFETCLNRSRGRIIHLLHADDKVKPGFYKKLGALLERYPQAGAAFCNYEFIDGKGNWLYNNDKEYEADILLSDQLLTMAERCQVQYVSIAVKREVYEKEGGFFGTIYGEDWEMWARIAKDHAFAYTPEILAEYRIHDSNISANSFKTGDNIRDISRVIDRIGTYLPAKVRDQITRKARRHYARYLLSTSEFIWHVSRDKKTVLGQVSGALKLHTDAFMMAKAAKIYAKVWLHPFRKMIGNVKD
ncbi:MAG TPA: glycosyltransferase, partial [Chitinophagaceae bacterium]